MQLTVFANALPHFHHVLDNQQEHFVMHQPMVEMASANAHPLWMPAVCQVKHVFLGLVNVEQLHPAKIYQRVHIVTPLTTFANVLRV